MKTNPGHFTGSRRSGVALVIVLSFVVLLTVAVVAYFSRTLSSRQVANDSYNGGRTEQLARNAMDMVVSDLKQEIVTGSYATNTVANYYPVVSATNDTLLRANMLPQRSGNPGTGPFTATNPDPVPNLVRISNHNDSSTAPTQTAPMVGSRASNVISTTPSANGRVVSLARWNQHFLVPQKDASGSKADPVTAFIAPDWVMTTQEEGPVALNSPTTDASNKPVTVTGRYAYAVYDEGGLLDANVAGFPSGASAAQIGTKTSQGMADLPTALGAASPAVTLSATAMVDKLVGWRNYATTQPTGIFPAASFASNFAGNTAIATSYFTSLQSNISGFVRTSNGVTTTGRTDQAFLSRQQLLGFQQAMSGSFPAAALQYLGTFSRELNAPSWGPSYDATEVGGGALAYRSLRDSSGKVNRLVPGVRFTKLVTASNVVTAFRIDGSTYNYPVKNGDPLVQRRFPLGRLIFVGPNGPRYDLWTGATNDLPTAIRQWFGLVWSPSTEPGLVATNGSVNVWRYVGSVGTANTDPTLTSVKKLSGNAIIPGIAEETVAREPNFFELLQEGILSGAMALDPNPPGNATTYAFDTTASEAGSNEYEIFHTGASIITQSQQSLQADGTYAVTYPTVIEYGHAASTSPTVAAFEGLAVGNDDLPYVNTVATVGGLDASTPATAPGCGVYVMFGLWNPHQSASTQSSPTNLPRPNVRLCFTAEAVVFNKYGGNTYGNVINPQDTMPYPGYTDKIATGPMTGVQTIQLSAGTNGIGANGFVDPHIMTTADLATPPGAGSGSGNAWATVPVSSTTTTPLPSTLPASYAASARYVGFRLPDFYYDPALVADYPLPLQGTAPNQYTTPYWGTIAVSFNNGTVPFNCWMEFQNPAGKWVPYGYFAGTRHDVAQMNKPIYALTVCMGPGYKGSKGPPDTRTGDVAHPFPIEPTSPPADSTGRPYDAQYYLHYYYFNSDPTTIRSCPSFGESPGTPPDSTHYWRSSPWSSTTETIYPSWPDNGRIGTQGTTTLFGGASSVWAPAGLARNNTGGPSPMAAVAGHDASNNPQDPLLAVYADADGVQRIGDSGLYPVSAAPRSNGWQGDPYALSTDRISDRPIVLHRAFTNVGELGYGSRDYPWKTLDFFSARSGDAGLLDLFTAGQNSESIGAGRINLNTRNLPALVALLSGSTDNVLAKPLTALTKPAGIAARLVALTSSTATGGGPLVGKDEIALRFVSSLSTTFPYSSSSDFGSADEQNLKPRREAVTRALVEAGQVRTWNLLVDIVAQSGRYAPNTTTLDKFTVEGERHYWLHVAIDRFTGQVIDQQLEAVTE